MPLIIPIFIPHEGCGQSCVFCNQRNISGFAGKPVTADDVRKTVEIWLQRSGKGKGKERQGKIQVAFYGGSFTGLPRQRQEELLTALASFIEQGRVDSLRLSTRPDYIDREVVDFLDKHQVGTVELGVQSMDNRVLAAARRGHTCEDVERAVTALRCTDMELGIQLMLGLPYDSRKRMMDTVRDVIALRPDFVRIYPVLVVRNSELANLYEHRDYTPLSLNMAVLQAAWMKKEFDRANIRVVRMGLQAGDQLTASLVAGPWHPAFGELVSSRLMLQRTRKLLAAGFRTDNRITLSINDRDQSIFRGMQSKNIKRLDQLGLWHHLVLTTDKEQSRHTVLMLSTFGLPTFALFFVKEALPLLL